MSLKYCNTYTIALQGIMFLPVHGFATEFVTEPSLGK